MAKTETKSLNITISAKIAQILEDGKYNRNKLIISLLKKHLEK